MKLYGLMSTYREGGLAIESVRSIEPYVDELIVFEGPAGAVDDAVLEAPPTDRSIQTVYSGSWPTDAAKRTDMIKHARRRAGVGGSASEPLWCLWLDADEILVNGHLLRDFLQRVVWEDERLGRTILDPGNGPAFSVPLTQVEHDGSLGRVLSRCVRGDLIRRYVVSSHVLELVTGQTVQHGLRPLTYVDTPQTMAIEMIAGLDVPDAEKQARLEAIEMRLFVPQLLAGEPHTIHRPHLRHPARQSLRMHEQERAELERHGLPTGNQEPGAV